MELPRQARNLLRRTAKVAPIGAGTADSAVPGPDEPGFTRGEAQKWTDGGLGFLDKQLGDQDRTDRYFRYMTIKVMLGIATATTPAAVTLTAIVIHESAVATSKVVLVIFCWLVPIVAVIATIVLQWTRRGSAEESTREAKGEVEQSADPKPR